MAFHSAPLYRAIDSRKNKRQLAVGYDVNPIAVSAARTNYLLMISDLLNRGRKKRIEIPVYLADSLLVSKRSTLMGEMYTLKTVAGDFEIPTEIVKGHLLPEVLSEISRALTSGYSVNDFKSSIRYRFKDISENSINILAELYEKLHKLEREGKNDVWVSILRNA